MQQQQEILENLRSWLEELSKSNLVEWEQIPEIELYMDQVIGYVDRQLMHTRVLPEEKILTPAMVNNYVKFGTLPKPEGKKYKRGHIARLFPLCVLKQTMSLPVIGAAIDDFKGMLGGEHAYNRYCRLQNRAFAKASSLALSAADDTPGQQLDSLETMAFELAIESAANRIVAERIMHAVGKYRAEQKKQAADAEKEGKARDKETKPKERRSDNEDKSARSKPSEEKQSSKPNAQKEDK